LATCCLELRIQELRLQGALADLLLVDGNPLDNIGLVADPASNFKIIMKDGNIYKNTLAR
jgi:imidazolonepropionase-like amidohydrolase